MKMQALRKRGAFGALAIALALGALLLLLGCSKEELVTPALGQRPSSWEHLLVLRSTFDPERPQSEIWVANADGSGEQKLISTQSYILSAAVSPDGKRIAFIAWDPREKSDLPPEEVGNLYSGEIWIANANGKSLRKVTRNAHAYYQITWSPDGRNLAFVSQRLKVDGLTNVKDLLLLTLGSGEIRRLARNNGGIEQLEYSWSPDGREIAFTSVQGPPAQIKIVGVDSGEPRALGGPAMLGYTPSWSPDGTMIAVDGWIMDRNGLNRRFSLLRVPSCCGSASWSPDSTEFVTTANQGENLDVYVINVRNVQARELISGPGNRALASWSPDGRKIAFFEAERPSPQSGSSLYSAHPDGSGVVKVTSTPIPPQPAHLPVWLP
jgi:TolB protein